MWAGIHQDEKTQISTQKCQWEDQTIGEMDAWPGVEECNGRVKQQEAWDEGCFARCENERARIEAQSS